MRTFSLKDDRTLSGHRLRRDERRVEGGGYVDPAGGALVPAHGVVMVPVGEVVGRRLKREETVVANPYYPDD